MAQNHREFSLSLGASFLSPDRKVELEETSRPMERALLLAMTGQQPLVVGLHVRESKNTDGGTAKCSLKLLDTRST